MSGADEPAEATSRRVTREKFHKYNLFPRIGSFNLLHRAGGLFQENVVGTMGRSKAIA